MSLWKQYVRHTWWVALGYLIILEAALVAAVLYWPKFRDNIPSFAQLVPFDAIQDLLAAMEHAGYWPYLAVQQWFKGCSLFGVGAIAFIGSGIIARESDQRTAEFLFSRPISRRRVLMVRHGAVCTLVLAPVVLTSISAIWLSSAVNEHLEWGLTLGATFYMCLFLWMLICMTTLISCWAAHQLTAGAVIVGIALLSFAFYLVQGLGDLSLFRLIDVRVFMSMRDGIWPWAESVSMVMASMLMLIVADRQLNRRDF